MAFASLGVNALRIVVEGMKRKDVRLKYIKKKKKFNGCFKSIVLGNSFRKFLREKKKILIFLISYNFLFFFHESDIKNFFKLSTDKFSSVNQTKEK